MRLIDRLEKKYGLRIENDGVWDPPDGGRRVRLYKIYTADGRLWERGLTQKGLLKECGEWGQMMVQIKRKAEENDNGRNG